MSVYYCETCGTPRARPRSERSHPCCNVCGEYMERMDVFEVEEWWS